MTQFILGMIIGFPIGSLLAVGALVLLQSNGLEPD